VVWAEQHVASGIVSLIVAIVPLWMVVLDWLRPGGQRPRAPVFLGLALGLAGLALLIGPEVLASHRANGGSTLNVGAALVPVLGSFLWAAGSIYTRQAAVPASPQMSTGVQMLAGGVVFLLVSIIAREPAHFHPRAVSTASVLGFLYLLTFGSLVGYTAYVYLLRATTAAKAATYAYVNPVVAVLLGWAVVSEPVTSRTLLAAAVILAGVAIITMTKSAGDPVSREADLENAPALHRAS
jgi:drug/metabolite transporter (DMT)-like permease